MFRGLCNQNIIRFLAEGVGFEPTAPEGAPVFKTGVFSLTRPPFRNGGEGGVRTLMAYFIGPVAFQATRLPIAHLLHVFDKFGGEAGI